MISVVCVYNNEEMFSDVLFKSLKNQTVAYELIALDNRDKRFKSAAEALNYGGEQAKGEYIMFVHQDMWLASDRYLEEAEKIVATIPDLGVAGVAGQTEKGGSWSERCRWSIEEADEVQTLRGRGPVRAPEVVQTLDECLLIVPRRVFEHLKFDERTFDGWDGYGADYCLSVAQMGLRAYVIPGRCTHSCRRASYELWEFPELLKYHKRLYKKHRKNHKHIYTWTGEASWLSLKRRSFWRRASSINAKIFPKIKATLRKELADCDTVLDMGCGRQSILDRCNVGFSVGVDMFEPALQDSRRKRIHTEYVRADLRHLEFKPKSFDAVMAMDVLEHLTKAEGIQLLERMERWARKKVIILTPNGYFHQDIYDGNPLQAHKSGWSVDEFREQGYRVAGLFGWKRLRGDLAAIKYRPVRVWTKVSDVTQKVTYRFPKLAFHLLATKRVDKDHEG